MSLQPYQKIILELLVEQELLMAKIYKRFSELFPEFKEAYEALVAEELEHGGWIAHLSKTCEGPKTSFVEGNTRTYTIKAMISYLKEFIGRMDREKLSHVQALTLVLDIERSLIERNAFQRFDGDSKEVAQVLKVLEDEQKEHIRHINELLLQVRVEKTTNSPSVAKQ